MPKPCALSRVGTPAHSTSAYLTHARIRFVPGWLWRGGGIGWPTVALAPILVKPMRHNASALFRATFGVAPRAAASAPGRVNLIGEHTDYNGGPVLPLATPLRTTVAVGPADAGVLELISTLDGERARIDWREGRAAGWSAYLAGVMRELDAAGAAPAGAGARGAVASDVPGGAGVAPPAGPTRAAGAAAGRPRPGSAHPPPARRRRVSRRARLRGCGLRDHGPDVRRAGAARPRPPARVRVARGAPHPDTGAPVARGHGHAARAHGGGVERAARRVRGSGSAPEARPAGAGLARKLARALAAAPEARPSRAAAVTRAARRGRDGADPVRRAAVGTRSGATIRRAAVRVARIVSAAL